MAKLHISLKCRYAGDIKLKLKENYCKSTTDFYTIMVPEKKSTTQKIKTPKILIMYTCLTSWTSSGFFLEIICVKKRRENSRKCQKILCARK